jgi:hypothetical protein
MRRRRENKKLLRLNDEENRMLMELCERYSMGVNEMLRYLIRKEYERITQNNTPTLGQPTKLDVLERKEALINEIKQLADQCVKAYWANCLEMNDNELTEYLVSVLPLQDLDLFRHYHSEMLRVFRERAKELMNQLSTVSQETGSEETS